MRDGTRGSRLRILLDNAARSPHSSAAVPGRRYDTRARVRRFYVLLCCVAVYLLYRYSAVTAAAVRAENRVLNDITPRVKAQPASIC